MIEEPWIIRALRELGFDEGWAISDNEIIVWEHEAPQPTIEELEAILPRD